MDLIRVIQSGWLAYLRDENGSCENDEMVIAKWDFISPHSNSITSENNGIMNFPKYLARLQGNF